MRRIIKPFTVELRSGKRKPPAPLALPPDQPSVDWPEALLAEFRADPEPSRPAGRVLPALDETPEPLSMRAGEDDAAEFILAASVTEPAPEPLETSAPREVGMPVAVAPLLEAEGLIEAGMPVAVPAPAPDAPSIRRARLSRDAFARGERWKARLPAAVHRTRRGFRTERGGSP